MSSIETHPIPTVPGRADAYIGVDIEVGESIGATTVTGFFLNRSTLDTTGAVTAQIRNAGGDNIEITLSATEQSKRAGGSVSFAASEKILLRVTASDALSMSLGGSFDLQSVVGAGLTYLTTLPHVRAFLGLVGTESDALIQDDLIPFVSQLMQQWMARTITQVASVTELHDVPYRTKDLPTYNYPFDSVAEVRHTGAVVAAADYKVIHSSILRRIDDFWGKGEVEIDLTNAGFATIPPALLTAATAEVAHAYRQAKGGHRLGMTTGSVQGQSDSAFVPWTFLPMTIEAMRQFRRVGP